MNHKKQLPYIAPLILLILLACRIGPAPEATDAVKFAPIASASRPTEPPAPVAVVPDADAATTVQADADRDRVFAIRQGQREQLPASQQVFLTRGDGVDVDETGRAILRFADLLSVEVMRDGELTLQELSLNEQSAFVSVLQVGGTVIHDFNPEAEIERRFTVQTEFATITAVGTRFIVAKEAGSPLEWIIGLDAAADDLWVYADGITKTVVSDQARWIAPFGEPSAGIAADMPQVMQWLDKVQQGAAQKEAGEVVWDNADMTANTASMSDMPQPGQTFDMQFGENGAVKLTLAEQSPFGSPVYNFDDCNGDGIPDLIIERGTLRMDFRPVPARVQALDVTVINAEEANTGSLTGFNPGNEAINRDEVTVGVGEGQILSLRAAQPYHFAELSMLRGCFLGFSLTPPKDPPRPAIDTWQGETVEPKPDEPTPTITFISIDTPPRQSSNVVNGFVLSGEATVPFERDLVLVIETIEGEVIQMQPLRVDGGELGGAPGYFKAEIFVDYPLPANLRLRVQNLSPKDGATLAEDSVLLTPLQPIYEQIGPVERPLENGWMEAIPVGFDRFPNFLALDGDPDDWYKLMEMSGVQWTEITHIAPEFQASQTCANRFPTLVTPDPSITDLAGRVAFAYDEEALYTAFWVDDDGFVGYFGDDYRYFRGDAPQLSLDVDLPGDYAQTDLNDDDLQIDLSPGIEEVGDLPQAALWQLQSLSARALFESRVAATPTESGYFVEAAIPWSALNFTPEPGRTLGVAASISENDTPDQEIQECMLTTAPQRNWRDPTSWGTLVLSP